MLDEIFDRLREISREDSDDWDSAELTYLLNKAYELGASRSAIEDEVPSLFEEDELVKLSWGDFAIPRWSFNEKSVNLLLEFHGRTTTFRNSDGSYYYTVPEYHVPQLIECENCGDTFHGHVIECVNPVTLDRYEVCDRCSPAVIASRVHATNTNYESIDNLVETGLARSLGFSSYEIKTLRDAKETTWPYVSIDDHVKVLSNKRVITRLQAYSTSPFQAISRSFLHVGAPPKNKRYYGVELEVEPHGDHDDMVAALAKLIWPYGILTSDASLRDGAEIKTLPATLGAHREIWKPFFAGKPNKYAQSWASGRCGMHVHVSAESISHLTLGKLQVFYNSRPNWSLINLVAGRKIEENEYCMPTGEGKLTAAFGAERTLKHYQKIKRQYYQGRAGSGAADHHRAFVGRELNGKATYELRIFRGNLAPAGFFKNLEFTDAVISWCEESPLHDIKAGAFLEWMRNPVNLARYRYLGAFLAAKEQLPAVPGIGYAYVGEEVGHAD